MSTQERPCEYNIEQFNALIKVDPYDTMPQVSNSMLE